MPSIDDVGWSKQTALAALTGRILASESTLCYGEGKQLVSLLFLGFHRLPVKVSFILGDIYSKDVNRGREANMKGTKQ